MSMIPEQTTAPAWRRSTRCASANNCVEVATDPDYVMVRDSKDPEGRPLVFTHAEWAEFVQGVKAGEFDPPVALPDYITLDPTQGSHGETPAAHWHCTIHRICGTWVGQDDNAAAARREAVGHLNELHPGWDK